MSTTDPELTAMRTIVRHLEALEDPQARARVISYLYDRYGVPFPEFVEGPGGARDGDRRG